MQTVKKLATKAAEEHNKLGAYLNAKANSKKAEELYTLAQKQQAQQIFEAVRNVYVRSKCYLTFRKTFITVKVANVKAADKLNANKLDALFASANVQAVQTKQGLILRFN